MSGSNEKATVERMSLWQRVEHGLLALCVLLLVATGLALVYRGAGWAHALISATGGLEGSKLLHKIAAVGLVASGLLHLAGLLLSKAHKEDFRGLALKGGDLRDALVGIRYELSGGKGQAPSYGRFTPLQKLQYWGIVLGCLVMAITGSLLWAHQAGVGVSLDLFNLMAVIHSNQAQLIFVALLLWHLYDVHIGNGNFPMNPAWLTGHMRETIYRRQHRSTAPEGGKE